MRVTRKSGGIIYETDADSGTLWHRGACVLIDQDKTSTNSRHHPVLNQIGPGWTWLTEHTSSSVWWIHESGLHLILTTEYQGVWSNETLWPSLVAVINTALTNKLTGFRRLRVENSVVTLR